MFLLIISSSTQYDAPVSPSLLLVLYQLWHFLFPKQPAGVQILQRDFTCTVKTTTHVALSYRPSRVLRRSSPRIVQAAIHEEMYKHIYVQKEKKKKKRSRWVSDHRALLLPEVRVRRLVVGRDHVGGVPLSHRGRRALHHHQPDGRLRRLRVRGVLLGRIFAPAVIHDTWYQEDQEQDNVAGDEDAKVQSNWIDLLVVFQKAHGARFMLGGPGGLAVTGTSEEGEAAGINWFHTNRKSWWLWIRVTLPLPAVLPPSLPPSSLPRFCLPPLGFRWAPGIHGFVVKIL